MHAFLQAIHGIDVSIYYFLSRFAGNVSLCRLARLEEGNDLLKGGIYFTIFWYLWFRIDSGQERRRRDILTILIGANLAIFASRILAFIAPFEIRPIYDPALAHPLYPIQAAFNIENWSSFPSDTAAYFFALAFGIAYLSRRLAFPIVLYTAGWVCLSRMYLGLHYASDTLVGIAIGTTIVWISLRSDFVQSTVVNRLLAPMDAAPQWFYTIAFLVSFEMATVYIGLRTLGNFVIHGVEIELHLGTSRSNANTPISAWGGLLAMLAFLAIVPYLVFVLSRKTQSVRAMIRSRVTRFRPTWLDQKTKRGQ